MDNVWLTTPWLVVMNSCRPCLPKLWGRRYECLLHATTCPAMIPAAWPGRLVLHATVLCLPACRHCWCSPAGMCNPLSPRPSRQVGTPAQTTATPSRPTMCGPSTWPTARGGRSGPLARARCRALRRHTLSMRRPAAMRVGHKGPRDVVRQGRGEASAASWSVENQKQAGFTASLFCAMSLPLSRQSNARVCNGPVVYAALHPSLLLRAAHSPRRPFLSRLRSLPPAGVCRADRACLPAERRVRAGHGQLALAAAVGALLLHEQVPREVPLGPLLMLTPGMASSLAASHCAACCERATDPQTQAHTRQLARLYSNSARATFSFEGKPPSMPCPVSAAVSPCIDLSPSVYIPFRCSCNILICGLSTGCSSSKQPPHVSLPVQLSTQRARNLCLCGHSCC